jgi:hypothetical protein
VAFADCGRRDGGRRRCVPQPSRYAATLPGDRSGPDRRIVAKLCDTWSALVTTPVASGPLQAGTFGTPSKCLGCWLPEGLPLIRNGP